MPKIYSPNKEYTGISASVTFIKGVGETEDKHLIDWFKSKGYEIENVKGDIVPDTLDIQDTGNTETENIDTEKYTEESLKEIKERKDLMKIAEILGYNAPHNIATETLIKKILELQN